MPTVKRDPSRPAPVTLARIGAALVAALAGGCAHGGLGSTEGWSAIKSKHFTVYVENPRDAQLTLTDLELAYASVSTGFFKSVELPSVDVLVLPTEAYGELMGFRRRTATLAKAPGAGPIGAGGLLILRDDRARGGAAEALTHLFIHRAFPNAPLWFHEGFSSYASTVQYREGNGERLACFGHPITARETLVPLDKLVTISWDDYDGDEARTWYKHTARTLLDYVLHGAGGKLTERMRPLVQAVGAGQPARETIEAAFPNVALSALDKKLSEHAADVVYQSSSESPRRGLCPLAIAIPAARAADEAAPAIEPASAQALHTLFEGLLKLPLRDGYPPWYPPDVIARVK